MKTRMEMELCVVTQRNGCEFGLLCWQHNDILTSISRGINYTHAVPRAETSLCETNIAPCSVVISQREALVHAHHLRKFFFSALFFHWPRVSGAFVEDSI